jgi:hypothetical protein
MGIFKKDELILDFNGVKTENISSTIPYLNKLDTQAKMLVNQLGPMSKINTKSMILFNESDNYDMYRLFEKSNGVTNNDNNFSETSPFISSDIYKILNKKTQRGGADDDEEESSTTSSDSSDSDNKKKRSKSSEMDEESEVEEDRDMSDMSEMSYMSRGSESYLSSSAHTDGVESDTMVTSNTSSVSASGSAPATATATATATASASVSASLSSQHQRRRKNRHVMSDSVNTSDINIISVDDN